jgi:hypothetical protein
MSETTHADSAASADTPTVVVRVAQLGGAQLGVGVEAVVL